MDELTTATGTTWSELPARQAIGGYDTAEMAAVIDSALALRVDYPQYILILLGANDVIAMPSETDWKTNYRYILDACHTNYPSALIGCLKTFREGYATELATLNGWLDDLIAEHPDYLFDGYDSADILSGHPELYTGGVHPNHAGYVLMAEEMTVILLAI